MTFVPAATRSGPFARRNVIPGFGLALGTTLAYLTLLVLLPLAALIARAATMGAGGFLRAMGDARVLAALRVSFGLSFAAALLASVMGLVIAWVVARYRFPGHRLFDAAIDIPFALPTAVAGIALAALYGPNGWLGAPLLRAGLKVAYTPLGIFVALVFVSLPFAVRSVQPLIEDIERDIEEAAATLGAGRARAFLTVLLPPLWPALLTGFVQAFARAVGEYGSVIFIAGNFPFVSEIAPLLIVVKLEQFDYAGATVIAVIMLAIAFLTLLVLNGLQALAHRRLGYA